MRLRLPLSSRARTRIVAGLALGMAFAPVAFPAVSFAGGVAEQGAQAIGVPSLKTVDTYDAEIRALGSTQDVAAKIATGKLDESGKLTLMRRSLVQDAGYGNLVKWVGKSRDRATFLEWFLNETDVLEYYVTGGKPGGINGNFGGSHVRSISQLMDLAREYEEDLKSADEADAPVYRKMMVSAALGMCDMTHLWTGDNPKADPVTRYGYIKTLRAHSETYHFKKEIFDKLPVEQMRWIFENRIADQEIPWLANYSNWFVGHDDQNRKVYKDGKPTEEIMSEQAKEDERLNAYTYTEYSGWTGDYNDLAFYDEKQLNDVAVNIEDHGAAYERQNAKKGTEVSGGWAQKYRFDYKDPNFPGLSLTNEADPAKKNTRLWMAFEKGGVCGAIAKTSENVSGVSGLPATVCGQPGHAATLRYELITVTMPDGTQKQKMGYTIQNDVYGWLTTQTPEQNHKLCGWEEVHKQVEGDGTTRRYGGGPFVLLAQDALDQYGQYVKAHLLLELAEASDEAGKMAAIDKAIEVQPFNLSATTAKIELMAKVGADKAQWLALADRVAADYVYYPLPMHSIMKLIGQKGGAEVMGAVEGKRIATLERATTATENDVDQADACKSVAKALLDKADSKVALFSFNGEDAGVLKLGPQFNDSSLQWKYSLDGGAKWIDVKDNAHEVQLTEEQLSQITAEHDIKVQLYGVDTVHTIDITEGVAPEGWSVNDPERCIYLRYGKGYDTVEIEYDGEWHKLEKGKPLPTDKPLRIRSAAQGTQLASTGDKVLPVRPFSSAWDPEDAQVVHASDLKINDASGHYSDCRAERAVDGYYDPDDGQIWETGVTVEPYIVIDLGSNRAIRHLDLLARARNTNGNLKKIEISAALDGAPMLPQQDGDKSESKVDPNAFVKFGDFDIEWGSERPIRSRLTFAEPLEARYVRIKALDTERTDHKPEDGKYKGTASAREFIFYEEKGAVAPELQERAISVHVDDVTENSILLSAVPSAGLEDGVIEYAIDEQDPEGAQNLAWQTSPLFEGLKPGTTYHAYARITGGGEYKDAESASISVVTLQPGPAPEPGPKPEPGPEPGPQPDPNPQPSPDPCPDPSPDPAPHPGPDDGSQHGPDADGGHVGSGDSHPGHSHQESSGEVLPQTGDPLAAGSMVAGVSAGAIGLLGAARLRIRRKRR